MDGMLKLGREGVLTMWASIEAKLAQAFSPTGATMNESRSVRTHIVMTRYHRDIDVSALAWLYEARLKSAPRWFKILKVSVTEGKGSQMFKFEVRLVESKADIVEPVAEKAAATGPAWGLPEGVKL
jgi:head-tail adaptor